MNQFIISLLTGIIFGTGLILSGMTQPAKVIGFLDIAGAWNPSLMFVMIGAIASHALAYRLITKRSSPLLAESFAIPSLRKTDPRLLTGSFVFGLGWGLAGICPGPAIVAVTSLQNEAVIFMMAMLGGMFLFTLYENWSVRKTILADA
jgi:uncharacterized membrane protein YedE/YeeE